MFPLLIQCILLAQLLIGDADLASGPSPNDPTPALPVFAVTGDPKDRDVDYAKLRQDGPTIFVFIEASRWNRSMFRFLMGLEEKLGESDAIVAVWLTNDLDESKNYLSKIGGYFSKTALCVTAADQMVPKDWGINPDAGLTAVAARKSRVVKSWGFRVPNEQNAQEVAESLKSN